MTKEQFLKNLLPPEGNVDVVLDGESANIFFLGHFSSPLGFIQQFISFCIGGYFLNKYRAADFV